MSSKAGVRREHPSYSGHAVVTASDFSFASSAKGRLRGGVPVGEGAVRDVAHARNEKLSLDVITCGIAHTAHTPVTRNALFSGNRSDVQS
eukprot:scaffold2674_cov333-Prasinococcus_capsulatus_cf.AAC.8